VPEADSRSDRLDDAIADLYGGPLEEFVVRRDALAKELRSAGDTASASLVKSLRKPSRAAWALDLAALDGDAIENLLGAVRGLVEAQTSGGDVRTALAELRTTVREFAEHASRLAAKAGNTQEPAALANAVLATLGNPERFDQLCAARLADVPDAGALDFLTLASPPARVQQAPTPKPREKRQASQASRKRAELETAAREAARQAKAVLDEARERAKAFQRSVRTAEANLKGAESRLKVAEEEAMAAQTNFERVNAEAKKVADQVVAAEKATEEAEQRLESLIQARF
jgi:hypothetical protein